jgi:hypothetical protein
MIRVAFSLMAWGKSFDGEKSQSPCPRRNHSTFPEQKASSRRLQFRRGTGLLYCPHPGWSSEEKAWLLHQGTNAVNETGNLGGLQEAHRPFRRIGLSEKLEMEH